MHPAHTSGQFTPPPIGPHDPAPPGPVTGEHYPRQTTLAEQTAPSADLVVASRLLTFAGKHPLLALLALLALFTGSDFTSGYFQSKNDDTVTELGKLATRMDKLEEGAALLKSELAGVRGLLEQQNASTVQRVEANERRIKDIGDGLSKQHTSLSEYWEKTRDLHLRVGDLERRLNKLDK